MKLAILLISATLLAFAGCDGLNSNSASSALPALTNSSVNAADYGVKGDGHANDSVALQAAIDAAIAKGARLVIPPGTYRVNVIVAGKLIVEGAGSTSTILTPYSLNQAAMTYTAKAPYWTYHSEVKDIGFKGSGKSGIGFTFAKSDPSDYQTGDEYAGNVKFSGCRFSDLEKGVQFPFGNIGSEFYSCGWTGNHYGVYALDNKFGGTMHSGNKAFFGGQFDSNDCAIYVHDSADGAGGWAFTDTIIEYNSIGVYYYGASTAVPAVFRGIWLEGNGATKTYGAVTLDSWSGNVRQSVSLPARSFILDGASTAVRFDGGLFTDMWLRATRSTVEAVNARVESSAAHLGAESTVDDATSLIRIRDWRTDGGGMHGARILHEGIAELMRPTISSLPIEAISRWFIAPHRAVKQTGTNIGGVAQTFTSQANLSGSMAVSGSVVADGVLFTQANSYTIPFNTTSQYVSPAGTGLTTQAGWYVFTIDVKVTSGTPKFFVWDRSSSQMVALAQVPENGVWTTLAGYGYSPGGQQLYFDISAQSSTTLSLSAYQLHRFGTEVEAQDFIRSETYIY